jgi:hypothetical protein
LRQALLEGDKIDVGHDGVPGIGRCGLHLDIAHDDRGLRIEPANRWVLLASKLHCRPCCTPCWPSEEYG